MKICGIVGNTIKSSELLNIFLLKYTNVKAQTTMNTRIEPPKKVMRIDDIPACIPGSGELTNCARKIAGAPRNADDTSDVKIFSKNGVIYVKPYWIDYIVNVKARWVGRKLIDVFISEFLGITPNYVEIACKLGRITVNSNKKICGDYVLRMGNRIVHKAHRHEHPILSAPIEILVEDENLLVINKPAGVPVHPCGKYGHNSILSILKRRGYRDLRAIHRLDRTTTGVLILAKNLKTDVKMKSDIASKICVKEYVCNVDGVFPPDEEIICEKPLGRLISSMGIHCVRTDGKFAKTRFRRISTDGTTSVVRCVLETGRTHQIRIHLQYLGFPIVDDYIYNSYVWGPMKGKEANYGKSIDEIGKDVAHAHRESLWHEEINPDYECNLERIITGEVEIESLSNQLNYTEDFDPICKECNVRKRSVPLEFFKIRLHCSKYMTSEWCFSVDSPSWAKNSDSDFLQSRALSVESVDLLNCESK